MRRPLVPCPGCLSRAPWVGIPETSDALEVAVWKLRVDDGIRVDYFNHEKTARATLRKRVVGGTVTYMQRDSKHCAKVVKGYQCNGCANLEEGAF